MRRPPTWFSIDTQRACGPDRPCGPKSADELRLELADLLEVADWCEKSAAAAHVHHNSALSRQLWVSVFVLRHELHTRARALESS